MKNTSFPPFLLEAGVPPPQFLCSRSKGLTGIRSELTRGRKGEPRGGEVVVSVVVEPGGARGEGGTAKPLARV